MNSTPPRTIQGAFAPLRAANTQVKNTTASGTPALLMADLTNSHGVVRRVLIRNAHATQTISVCLVAKGASIAALTTSDGYSMAAGERLEFIVDADTSVALVASGAATTFTAWISDT